MNFKTWQWPTLIFGLLIAGRVFADNQAMVFPAVFNNTWIEASIGFDNYGFTNSNLAPGFTAESIDNTNLAARLLLGHNFNPYLGATLSLMRGFLWTDFNNINNTDVSKSVWNTLLGLTVRPMLPIQKITLYGDFGMGLTSRHGFDLDGQVVVSNASLLSPIIGGGLTYRLSTHFLLDWNTIYAFPNSSQNQPYTFYSGLGVIYLFQQSASASSHPINSDFFPKNFLQFSYTSRDIIYIDAAPYFSEGGIPLFYKGQIKFQEGALLQYERTIFHTAQYFSVSWGLSAGRWESQLNHQIFCTLSAYPELKFWFFRSQAADLYMTYSQIGPSYISQVYIDNKNTGKHFTFQDLIGFGAFLGESKRFDVNLKIVHFSNGNIFPNNPGLDVPVMLSLGYAF